MRGLFEVEQLLGGRDGTGHVGDALLLEVVVVGHGHVGARDALDGGVEIVEAPPAHAVGDLRAHAVERPALLEDEAAARLLDGLDDELRLPFEGAPDPSLYSLAEEKALADAIDLVKVEASVAVMNEDFASAMGFMAELRPAVDAFFDKVKVNDDDPKIRENRLKLLNEIRSATRAVADFSRIEG